MRAHWKRTGLPLRFTCGASKKNVVVKGLRALRGSLPGAESVRAASAGTAVGARVKRSLGCTEGVMSASLSAAQLPQKHGITAKDNGQYVHIAADTLNEFDVYIVELDSSVAYLASFLCEKKRPESPEEPHATLSGRGVTMSKSCTLKTVEQDTPYLPQQANACQMRDLHVRTKLRPQQMTIAKSVSGSANGSLCQTGIAQASAWCVQAVILRTQQTRVRSHPSAGQAPLQPAPLGSPLQDKPRVTRRVPCCLWHTLL